jgi:chemotaxis protein MotB
MSANSNKPVLIKKVKKVIGGGHHGGAWKVAYADFVTAMMAFFLLMWLINTTSPEQKRGIADYFAPASVSRSTQGSDGLLGGTAFQEDGARASGANVQVEVDHASDNRRVQEGGSDGDGQTAGSASDQAMAEARARRGEAEARMADVSLRQALQDMPDFAELSKQVLVDNTPEGIRIQLVDQEGRAMFSGSSDQPNARARQLLEATAKVIQRLPNRISISGHTDTSRPSNAAYTNWELSSARANAARRILESQGVDSERIYQVTGKAASEPLFPDDPDQPGNRRISIVLLREAPVLPVDHAL